MLGIVGPRGIGKTTLMLQRINQTRSACRPLYITADSLYFTEHTLYDTAEAFVKNDGTHLFVDEVHKYPRWSRELKAIYDAFPDLHVCFTGSSILDIELGQVITRTLEVDILQFAGMNASTGRKLARLKTNAKGIGALGKAEKIYLDNTNILYNLSNGSEDIGTVRETFFFNQMRANHLGTASAVADFAIDGIDFEVGGRSKGADQLAGAERGVVVKDGIEYGHGGIVPLWAFGFNY